MRSRAVGLSGFWRRRRPLDKLANLHDWRVVYTEVGERSVEFFKAPTLAARVRAWQADLEMGERVTPRLRLNARFREELEQFESERR